VVSELLESWIFGVRLTNDNIYKRSRIAQSRMELLVKRFHSRISSTTHLPPIFLVYSLRKDLVFVDFKIG
jgi:hypothetical protein